MDKSSSYQSSQDYGTSSYSNDRNKRSDDRHRLEASIVRVDSGGDPVSADIVGRIAGSGRYKDLRSQMNTSIIACSFLNGSAVMAGLFLILNNTKKARTNRALFLFSEVYINLNFYIALTELNLFGTQIVALILTATDRGS